MLHKVGSLWKGKSKDGKTFLSGNALGIRVLVYPVKDKKKDKSPDYTLSIEFPGDNFKRSGDVLSQVTEEDLN